MDGSSPLFVGMDAIDLEYAHAGSNLNRILDAAEQLRARGGLFDEDASAPAVSAKIETTLAAVVNNQEDKKPSRQKKKPTYATDHLPKV